jgi:uncharacterized protein (DUF362 family)
MAKGKITRRDFVGVSVGTVVLAGVGCSGGSSNSNNGNSGIGGSTGAGGGASGTGGANGGGNLATGGASPATGGSVSGATGGAPTGVGGGATGGESTGAGGAATGGASPTGGTSTMGAGGGATGGKAGTSTGGAATGGKSGTSAGGAATGGAPTGGKSSAGGAAPTGGTSGKATSATGGTSAPAGGASATGGTTSSGTTSAKLVGLVRNTSDIAGATQRAIELAGGLPPLAGRTVLLKPNLLTATASPCTPNPEIVRGVLKAVKAAGATKILIGDSAMSGTAVSVMQSVGIHAVNVAEAGSGVTITEVNFTTTTNVKPTGAAKWPNGVDVYKDLLDDGSGSKPYVINVACCKHHGIAVWTMVMKNWYGVIPSASRGHSPNGQGKHPQIPEIHLAAKEDFVILDATKAYITGGPSSGTQASPGIVVASADAVAAEATGLCILRKYRADAAVAKDDIENLKIFNTDTTTTMGRALTLGNGWISSRSQYTYATEGLGTDESAIMGQLDL